MHAQRRQLTNERVVGGWSQSHEEAFPLRVPPVPRFWGPRRTGFPQRTTAYVSKTAAVARAAMRTRCLRSQFRCIRCQSAAPSATRLFSGTNIKIDATEVRTQIASAVSRITRPGIRQQSQVWIPRSKVETGYQIGMTFPSTRAKRLSIFNCDAGSSRHAAGFTNADTENSTPTRVRTTKRVAMLNKCIYGTPIGPSLKTLSNGALIQKAAVLIPPAVTRECCLPGPQRRGTGLPTFCQRQAVGTRPPVRSATAPCVMRPCAGHRRGFGW